jgi:hypothetical protein
VSACIHMTNGNFVPFSNSCFRRSHCHRTTSLGDTTASTSSTDACLYSLTQTGSGQPTRMTSPSMIQRPQKLLRQSRQTTWEHREREIQRVPGRRLRHIGQVCVEARNWVSRTDTLCAVRAVPSTCGEELGRLYSSYGRINGTMS